MEDDYALIPAPIVARNHIMAGDTYTPLIKQMKKFQDSLNENEEVAAAVTQFGQTITITIESVGYQNPNLMIINGTTNQGQRCKLLQHLNQINILLVAVPATTQPAKRIGFKSP